MSRLWIARALSAAFAAPLLFGAAPLLAETKCKWTPEGGLQCDPPVVAGQPQPAPPDSLPGVDPLLAETKCKWTPEGGLQCDPPVVVGQPQPTPPNPDVPGSLPLAFPYASGPAPITISPYDASGSPLGPSPFGSVGSPPPFGSIELGPSCCGVELAPKPSWRAGEGLLIEPKAEIFRDEQLDKFSRPPLSGPAPLLLPAR
ncbi:hypothetical protein [Neomegalonema perideroedes]|uniref:hypothetical protein n=1 Tax=Neomegalonema perideroedes TaxID=217219 RepID=UPI0003A598AB|nr:hypothetical protein [Neomegalonema perideroedes]